MSIKGFKSQQALAKKLSNYTEDQSIDQARYVTVQEAKGRRHMLDTVALGVTAVNSTPQTVASGSSIRVIKCTSHGASKNDLIRLADGTEFAALSVPDANTIITSVELDNDPTGTTFTIWKYVTPSLAADGSIVASSGPIQYNRKSGGTTLATTVLEDLDTPANSRSLPVVIHSIDGAPINITAGDLNVQLSDRGSNPDATRIGDGVDLLAINTDGSLNIRVTDGAGIANTKQIGTAITSSDVALVTQSVIHGLSSGGGGGYVDVKVNPSGALTVEASVTSSVLPTGAATSALQTTGNSSLSSIDGKLTNAATTTLQTSANTKLDSIITNTTSIATSALQTSANTKLDSIITNTTSIATSALQTTGNTSLNNIDVNQGAKTDAVATTDTGTFSLIALIKKVAQNITSLAGQIPASLGVKVAASSLSIVPASDAVFNTNSSLAAGTITTTQKTVGTSAVRATVTGTAPSARKKLQLKPSKNNTGAIYYGSSAVTTANGLEIIGPDRLEFLLENNDYYLISDTAGQVVEILEVY